MSKQSNAGCYILPLSIVSGIVASTILNDFINTFVAVWVCFIVSVITFFILAKIWPESKD